MSFNTRRLGLAVVAAFLTTTPLQAADIKSGDLVIAQPWSRATPGGAKVAGGYVTITNTGSGPDRLVGGSAAVAGRVEVHEMAVDSGIMKMRQLEAGLPLPAGQTVRLAPGGLHLMLMDLKSGLKQGETVPVTLEFEKAGKVDVPFQVEAVGAGKKSDAGHGDHKGPGDHKGH